MAREDSAWCPGGLTAQKAFLASPSRTASTAAQAAPAALSAASPEAGESAVSGSRWTWPDPGTLSKISST